MTDLNQLTTSILQFFMCLYLAFFTLIFVAIPTSIYDAGCFVLGELPRRFRRAVRRRGYIFVFRHLAGLFFSPSRLAQLVQPITSQVAYNVSWTIAQISGYAHVAILMFTLILCSVAMAVLYWVYAVVEVFTRFSRWLRRTALWLSVAGPSFVMALLMFVPTYTFGACDVIVQGLYDEPGPRRRVRRRRPFNRPGRLAPGVLDAESRRTWQRQLDAYWRARLPEYPEEQLLEEPELEQAEQEQAEQEQVEQEQPLREPSSPEQPESVNPNGNGEQPDEENLTDYPSSGSSSNGQEQPDFVTPLSSRRSSVAEQQGQAGASSLPTARPTEHLEQAGSSNLPTARPTEQLEQAGPSSLPTARPTEQLEQAGSSSLPTARPTEQLEQQGQAGPSSLPTARPTEQLEQPQASPPPPSPRVLRIIPELCKRQILVVQYLGQDDEPPGK